MSQASLVLIHTLSISSSISQGGVGGCEDAFKLL